jgi:hypothetical protein
VNIGTSNFDAGNGDRKKGIVAGCRLSLAQGSPIKLTNSDCTLEFVEAGPKSRREAGIAGTE